MTKHIDDRPRDCRYCYFWKKTSGCTFSGETSCFYESPQTTPVSECDGCPYGYASPCIGWCTKELLRSLGLPREREQK